MSAIVRKTYDTDSIVLRRIFAVEPETNTRVSTNSVLVTGSSGQAIFQDGIAFLSTIGAPTSGTFASTVSGLGTIGYLSVGTAGDVTSGQLVSTAGGLGSLDYISSSQLISSIVGLGSIYLSSGGGGSGDVTTANLTSTTLGLGSLDYISSSQLISSIVGLGSIYLSSGGGIGDVTAENLTSTTLGLGTLNYISTLELFSTVRGLGSIYLSTGLLTIDLTSTTQGLGLLGYISTSQLISTVGGIAKTFSTVYYISEAGGINISGPTTGFYIDNTNANISTLINNNITINTTGGNVNDVDLVSTIQGLASFGYLSSAGGLVSTPLLVSSLQSTIGGLANLGYLSSAVDLVSTPLLVSSLQSTIRGLGTIGYLSTAVTKIVAGTNITIDPTDGIGILTINASGGGGGGGGSGDVTSTNLTSTTLGLGTLGYISASTLAFSLASTTANLARLGYVSSTALPSTVLGLSRFYVSTASLQSNLSSFSTSLVSSFFTRNLTASTITADLLNISTISFGTGNGFITFPFLRAQYISSFSTQTDYAIVNTYISGAQLQFSSLEGDGFLLTNLSTGIESTIRGLGTIGYLSSAISVDNLVSTPLLESTFASTLEGLGSFGYLSTIALDSTIIAYKSEFTTSSLTISSLSFGDTFGYIYLGDAQGDTFSTGRINTSSLYINDAFLQASTYISSTELKNLQINDLYVNAFGPVRVKKSTLGAEHAEIGAYDITKYFLFTQTNSGYSVALPPYDASFEGWNCVIRNMPDSTQSFAISTVKSPPDGTNIAPGTTVTILGTENSYYII
jgi:hypothetical protein